MNPSNQLTYFDKANALVGLLMARATGGDADDTQYVGLRAEFIRHGEALPLLPQFVRTCANLSTFWGFIQPNFKTYRERRAFISEQLAPLVDHFDPSRVSAPDISPVDTPPHAGFWQHKMPAPPVAPERNATMQAPIAPTIARNKRKVFIVHGRDNEAKQEVARFVTQLGLEPIILHEQASSGMTIIEKIERYANDADFALVLYTPCDKGRGATDGHMDPRFRARQNVVFEHGYLMAKLGRENVCALRKGDVETPNDISGVVYVELNAFGAWKIEVAKELKACGYTLPAWS